MGSRFNPGLKSGAAARRSVQIVAAFRWLFYLFGTYFRGGRDAVSPDDLFDERIGARGQDIGENAGNTTPHQDHQERRLKLAKRARSAVDLFKKTLHESNKGNALVNAADNQMAFWEMQVRGTNAGATAAWFLAELLKCDAPAAEDAGHLTDARMHLIGHSFGGLVVLNAARHLVHDPCLADVLEQNSRRPDPSGKPVPRVASICLLQAAVASNWFEDETILVGKQKDGKVVEAGQVSGAIACIYSAYDTANGFYYPVANGGRLAAGYVGLFPFVAEDNSTSTPPPLNGNRPFLKIPTPAQVGLLASLVESPDLRELLPEVYVEANAAGETAKQTALQAGKSEAVAQAEYTKARNAALAALLKSMPRPILLNLDASRLIYEGGKALGGGHGDIFKDDVVNLCWAVTHLGMEV